MSSWLVLDGDHEAYFTPLVEGRWPSSLAPFGRRSALWLDTRTIFLSADCARSRNSIKTCFCIFVFHGTWYTRLLTYDLSDKLIPA